MRRIRAQHDPPARAGRPQRHQGSFITKAGIVRRRLGRPGAEPEQLEQARQLLAQAKGIVNTARVCKLGTSTVQKVEARDAGGIER